MKKWEPYKYAVNEEAKPCRITHLWTRDCCYDFIPNCHALSKSIKAAPCWASHASCGLAGWCDYSTFDWVEGHATYLRSLRFARQMDFGIINWSLSFICEEIRGEWKPATCSARLPVFAVKWAYLKIKKSILTWIIIFRVTLCPFQHASRQSHYSDYLKVSKMPAIPQTRNPHVWPSVGPLNYCS